MFSVRCILLMALIISPQIIAQVSVSVSATPQPLIRFSTDTFVPVIEYNQIHYMLAEQDSTSLLRVYGNGRVHIHFPVYMKRAGDYELWLSSTELNDLLGSLSQDGIMDFDLRASLQHRQQLEQQQRTKDKMLFHISDITETVININLDEYRRSPQDKRIVNMKMKFSWKNLEHDARRFPQSAQIQGAAAGEQRLRRLLVHPGLQRLK